jgi:UDP-4-amino-4,6-dideoxy-N-acetyl-beta-L-altrosamine transaminase
MIPYGRQDINQADIDAVTKILRSDFLTQGPAIPAFENAVARYAHIPHAVAVNSATSALHIACLALGVGSGDRVWTSPITFVASANCALYCGAHVDFVDIDPLTFTMSVECLTEKLAQAEKIGQLPKVVIPVHLSGQSCDMAAIHALGKYYGFHIIEDASHAIGGSYQAEPVGSCRYSDITVFSFHPVKIITTGEGGMALTHDAKLANTMARLRSHGITRDLREMTYPPDGHWSYQQIDLGFNYRLTDIQAALGLSQMQRLEAFVARRNILAEAYEQAFQRKSLVTQHVPDDVTSARHLYIIRVDSLRHRAIFEELREQGVGVNLHYIPVYRQPYYERFKFEWSDFPESERYYTEAISLPLYPLLTDEQQDAVIKKVLQSLGS